MNDEYTPHYPVADPPRPYPTEPVQFLHARVFLQLARLLVDSVCPVENVAPRIKERVSRVLEWLPKCEVTVKRRIKPVSRAASKREAQAFAQVVHDCHIDEICETGETEIQYWYDGLYLLHLLCIDCLCASPIYYNYDRVSWSHIFFHLQQLADQLEADFPGTAEEAGDIHMAIEV